MKKSIFWLLVFFVFLTTYTPNFDPKNISNLLIKKILIKDNTIIKTKDLKKKLNFLYNRNLLFLKNSEIKEKIENEAFIESFRIKKIYPNTLKINILEKNLIAIIQNKEIKVYENLPIVFGEGKKFYSFYRDLKRIQFPIDEIKSFYFYESNRWDLILKNDKTIKLPTKEYVLSLQSFLNSRLKSEFENYRIFDYRIKNQLILN